MARTFELGLKLKAILDDSGFTQLNKRIVDFQKSSGPAFQQAGAKLQNIGKSAEQLSKKFKVASVAATALAGGSIREFGKFEDGIRAVQTLLNEDSFGSLPLQEGVDKLSAGVKTLSKDLGLGLDDLNKSLFDTISAGIDAGDAISTLETAGKLAVAGVTSISVATDGITSALNSYGDAAGSAEEVASKFFAAQKAGKTTVEELASGFGTVGASAASAGISLDELLSSVSAITLGGVRTRTAFTGLKAAIAGISKPTEDAVREAKRLGVVFNADELRNNGLTDFIKNLTENPNFGPNTISKLFGSTEAQGAINTLIAQIDTYGDTVETLGDKAGSIDTLTKAFEVQSDSAGKKLDILRAKFNVFIVNVGETLTPAFNVLADAAGGFFDIVSESKALQILTVSITTVVAAAAPLLFVFGKLATIAGEAAEAYGRLGSGSTKLINPITILQRRFGSFGDILGNVRKLISLKVVAILALIKAVIKIEEETQIFSTILSTLVDIVKNIIGFFGELVNGLSEAATGFSAVELAAASLDLIFSTLKDTAQVLFDALVVGLASILGPLTKLLAFGGAKLGLISDDQLKKLTQASDKLDDLNERSQRRIRIKLGIPTDADLAALAKEASDKLAAELDKEFDALDLELDGIEADLDDAFGDFDVDVEPDVNPVTIDDLIKKIQERFQNKKVFIDAEVNSILLNDATAREQLENQISTGGALQSALQSAADEAKKLFESSNDPAALAALNGYNSQILQVRTSLEEAREKLKEFVGELTVEQEINIDRSIVDAVKGINEELVNDAILRGETEAMVLSQQLQGLNDYKFALESQLLALQALQETQPNSPAVLENLRKAKGELVQINQKIDEISAKQLTFREKAALDSAERLKRSLENIPSTTTQLENGFASFAENANRGFENLVSNGLNSLTNELDAVVTGTKSAGDAFADFASGVLDQLRKILIQKALVAAIGSVFGDGGKAETFADGGTPLKDGGKASPFSNAIRLAAGGGGGKLHGPGGPRSDLIPAWLSNKEWVINAQSANSLGDPVMNTLNKFGSKGLEMIMAGKFATNMAKFGRRSTKTIYARNARPFRDGGSVDANGNPVSGQNQAPVMPNLIVNIENNSNAEIQAVQPDGPSFEDGVENIVYRVILRESDGGGILQRAAQAGG